MNSEPITPEHRVILARLDLDRLERELKQLFRRCSKVDSIYELSLWHRRANGFRTSPPHIVDQLVSAAAAYGVKNIGQQFGRQKVESAKRRCLDVGNPAHMIWIDRTGDLEMFMPVVHREQVQLQLNASRGQFVRLYTIYLDLLDDNARFGIEESLGVEILGLLHAAYFLALAFRTDECRRNACILNDELEYIYSQSALELSGFSDLIQLLAINVGDFGEKYLHRYMGLEKKEFSRSLRPMLLEYPMLDLGDGNTILPLPDCLLFCLERLLGTHARDERYIESYSTAFANYTRKLVGDLLPNEMVRPDEEQAGERRCDVKAKFDQYELVIECKATRFTRNFISPDTIRDDGSTAKIVSACEQLANSISQSVEFVAVIIVDDELAVPNSDWFWSLIMDRNVSVRDQVEVMKKRPLVWSLGGLEGAVQLCKALDTNILDLVTEYLSQPYHLHGEWETWMSSKRRMVNAVNPVRLLDWQEECLMEHFSFK